MTPDHLCLLLERALGEELGLAVQTNNPNYLYQQLTNLRTELQVNLIIARPSAEGWIFICKPTVELGQ